MAHNSIYRNIRFHFNGTLKRSYFIYLLLPGIFGLVYAVFMFSVSRSMPVSNNVSSAIGIVFIIITISVALLLPFWFYLHKKYFFDNIAFGSTQNTFKGKSGHFYKTYLEAFFMFMGIFIVAAIFIALGIGSKIALIAQGQTLPDILSNNPSIIILFVILYLVFIIGFSVVRQYIYAMLTNYCWNQSNTGPIKFNSTLKAAKLIVINLTNIIGILFSIGLLIPWAKIRRTRYILDNLELISSDSMDTFATSTGEDQSAVGDSAADFFDMDIGL